MIDLIQHNLDVIRDLCRHYGVRTLEVVGSASTGRFDPQRSDIDFLVDYQPGTDLGPWMKRHFELGDRLSEILGRPVDLIMPAGLRNPYVIASINASRQTLYAA